MSQDFSFSWENISVNISEKIRTFWTTKTKLKTILNNVSGCAKSNSLSAIMGASGSGKTTLLRAISGQCKEKEGILKISNKPVSDSDIKKCAGYVPQQDIFFELLTIVEYLQFIIAFRDKNQLKNKLIIIRDFLIEVNLDQQAFTLIKNLSGGEKRRLSLVAELIGNPAILFCDEPTTGLDSYSSTIIVKKLQQLAQSGKIILATIHQPSSQLFQYFDQLILLSKGKLFFQGTKQETERFFKSLDLFCPRNYNPADFYLKCIVQENTPTISKNEQNNLNSNNSMEFEHPNALVLKNYLSCSSLERKNKNSFFYELKWLFWRNYLLSKRNTAAKVANYLILMTEFAIVALIYSKVKLDNQENVQDVAGFLSFIGSELVFNNMYQVIYVFPEELAVFVKEKNLYSSWAYFMSKLISLIPTALLTTVGNMTILFIMVKFLDSFYLWLKMTLTAFFISITSNALGLAFSANFQSIEHVDLYLAPFEFLLLLFSGVLIKLSQVPTIFCWIQYISPFYYSFDILSNLIWNNVNMGNCTENTTFTCYKNGIEVLKNYGVYNGDNSMPYNFLFLFFLTLGLCLIGFVGIIRKRNTCNI